MLVNPEELSDRRGHHLDATQMIGARSVKSVDYASYPGKRAADILICVALILAFLPAMILIAVIIKLGSPGPVFFRQQRLGAGGERFHVLKFRTMVVDAEERLQTVLSECPRMRAEYAVFHKLTRDPRVTPFGRFLRKSSLDELPQLFNVLRGEMSIVGPRPYLPEERCKMGDAYDRIVRAKPGLTGPWQVGGRNRTTFAERVEIEQRYVDSCSVTTDLRLLLTTIGAVFRVNSTS